VYVRDAGSKVEEKEDVLMERGEGKMGGRGKGAGEESGTGVTVEEGTEENEDRGKEKRRVEAEEVWMDLEQLVDDIPQICGKKNKHHKNIFKT
jgi:hypothetical protein